MASVKNADYVERHIGSAEVRKVIIPDSYHMLTLDNQKELVAEETIRFFREKAESGRSSAEVDGGDFPYES